MKRIIGLIELTILFFTLATCLSGCCASYDCDNGIAFQLRLINKDSGKDLVYDENTPIESFKIISPSTNLGASITKQESTKTLAVSSQQASRDYELTFNSKIIPFSLEMQNDGDCCPDYKITNLTSPAPVQYIEKEQVFVIQI